MLCSRYSFGIIYAYWRNVFSALKHFNNWFVVTSLRGDFPVNKLLEFLLLFSIYDSVILHWHWQLSFTTWLILYNISISKYQRLYNPSYIFAVWLYLYKIFYLCPKSLLSYSIYYSYWQKQALTIASWEITPF